MKLQVLTQVGSGIGHSRAQHCFRSRGLLSPQFYVDKNDASMHITSVKSQTASAGAKTRGLIHLLENQ